MKVTGTQNVPVELPANADLVTFVDPAGREQHIPAFWRGSEWRVRYASTVPGTHRFDGGELQLASYDGPNPLFRHGPLRLRNDGRRFEHADSTPFLWLGDTWWLACTSRLGWPDEFRRLTDDRVAKGFSVIQLVAGLYPEMPPFDPRGGDEWPWRDGFSELDPGWWDGADLKLAWLVGEGLVPCVVAAWGYHLLWTGVETMKRHWREVIARWGAYPVVWCLAGEATLPYYPDIFGERAGEVQAQLREGWAEVARYVREIDPYARLLTVHPSPGDGCFSSYDIFPEDSSLFDFSMLQTGHWDERSFGETLTTLQADLAREPPKPVLNAEVCYEGIMSASWHNTQRFLVWSHLLSGAAGHTYGAQGLWSMNTGDFVGEAGSWADTTWEEAYRLPGSTHVGIAKRVLERYRWWALEPHPEWVDPHWTTDALTLPYAAGIPDEVRIVYFPSSALVDPPRSGSPPPYKEIRLHGLDSGWAARYVDPRTGADRAPLAVEPDASGTWTIGGGFLTSNPSMEDWVLVLERR
jgi:Protein of unknown function (DUF4038)